MADKRISQLIERTDIANNDVLPIVASGATTTNKVTISTIQNWMQDNLDVGVTSVGITLGSSGTDVNVTGSPITTSGNITINIPTASATNRGLLSAADWSTFNGKQNSITLTTSGTSGAATLVGSTLNIPNYSTGVANAYVPYVGAIGSVTLGYNSLSASQINIDGASPTGGSYLGFKHSTSVNTGTDGYTSMYTFGTNTIAFKSVSGGNSKDFSFSMVGITPNVSGGRQYTLPDASGTLALTSDLSGYVTIGTTQTITGSKTFNSRIIGQDATLTSSGSTNTLEVFHTSGSGHAVEIQKAGNGEGLRVIKTSGSGNAVTISGGLLSAEAATFSGSVSTGRLTATGSDFHSFIVPGGTAQIKLERTSSSTGLMYIGADSDGFSVMNPSFSKVATITSTGAATFTGALNGTSATFTGVSPRVSAQGNSSTGFPGFQLSNTTQGYEIIVRGNASNALQIRNSTASTDLLSIASTGAATFSSSVTSQGGIFTAQPSIATNEAYSAYLNDGGQLYVGIDNSTGSGFGKGAYSYNFYGNANRPMVFSTDGTTRLTIAGTGAATFSSSVGVGGSGATYSTLESSSTTFGTTVPLMSLAIKDGTYNPRTTISYRTQTGSAYSVVFDSGYSSGWAATNYVFASGNVGIGTASPPERLSVVTSTNYAATFNTSSIENTTTRISIGSLTTGGGGTGGSVAIGSAHYHAASAQSQMLFYTHDGSSLTERMRITSGGDVLVGITNNSEPSTKSIRAGLVSGQRSSSSDSPMQSWNQGTTGDNKLIEFYTEAGTLRGSIDFNRGAGLVRYNTTSDANLKNIIGDSDKSKSIEILNSTKIREYSWKDDESNKPQIGVIAQELHETFKGAVSVGSDEELLGTEDYKPWAVDKTAFTFHLIAGWQEHQRIIQELRAEIEALKSQING